MKQFDGHPRRLGDQSRSFMYQFMNYAKYMYYNKMRNTIMVFTDGEYKIKITKVRKKPSDGKEVDFSKIVYDDCDADFAGFKVKHIPMDGKTIDNMSKEIISGLGLDPKKVSKFYDDMFANE